MKYREILDEIKPKKSEKEKIETLCKTLIDNINDIAKKENIPVEATLVGSVAKGTWLSGKADIDIFLPFPLATPEDELREKGLYLGHECIKKVGGKAEEKYAAHPYVTGHIQGYEVDFVPCYKIKDANQLRSAVDRTLLHTKYIQENLDEEKKDEVLLLKKFMEGIETYGSEFKVGGFSGYLCELLILYYDSFENVLKAASNEWRPGYVIDIENYGTSRKFRDPLIVIDPVDKNRNVASALTMQKMTEFIVAARNFLENPKKDYFYPVKLKVSKEELKKEIKKRGSRIVAVIFKHPKLPADTLYPQLKKTEMSIKKHLNKEGFKVLRSGHWSNEEDLGFLIFEFEVWRLPKYKKHFGPKFWIKKHYYRFLRKYGKENVWVEKDRVVSRRKRKNYKVESYIKELLKSGKIRVGKDIKNYVSKSKVMNETEFLDYVPKQSLEFLKKFLNPGIHLWR